MLLGLLISGTLTWVHFAVVPVTPLWGQCRQFRSKESKQINLCHQCMAKCKESGCKINMKQNLMFHGALKVLALQPLLNSVSQGLG